MKKKFVNDNLRILIGVCVIILFLLTVFTYVGWGQKRILGKVTSMSEDNITIVTRKNEVQQFSYGANTTILQKSSDSPQIEIGDVIFIEILEKNYASKIRITPGKKFNELLKK